MKISYKMDKWKEEKHKVLRGLKKNNKHRILFMNYNNFFLNLNTDDDILGAKYVAFMKN